MKVSKTFRLDILTASHLETAANVVGLSQAALLEQIIEEVSLYIKVQREGKEIAPYVFDKLKEWVDERIEKSDYIEQ